MKKVLLVLAALIMVAGLSTRSFAEGKPRSTKAVTVNLLATLINVYSGSFELAVLRPLSIKMDLTFSPNVLWASGLTWVGLGASARFYPFFRAVNGLWIGGGLNFESIGDDVNRFTIWYANVSAGFKWVLGKSGEGFYLEPWVGYKAFFTDINTLTSGGIPANVTTPLMYGLGIGWAF